MTTFLILITLLVVFVALWVTVLRPWLIKKPWAASFFAWIEPIEIALWSKSETILWSRIQVAVGALLQALVSIGSIDLSPMKPILPQKFQWIVDFIPMVISLYGVIGEVLRRDTTKPLALVAVSSTAAPEVQAVVARSDATTAIAVEQLKGAT